MLDGDVVPESSRTFFGIFVNLKGVPAQSLALLWHDQLKCFIQVLLQGKGRVE